LTPDLPGHGRSSRAPSYTFDAQAELIAEVLPTDRDLVLLGHAMGGMVALAMSGFTQGYAASWGSRSRPGGRSTRSTACAGSP
jgi:surfactin synthase thioesterase subunit